MVTLTKISTFFTAGQIFVLNVDNHKKFRQNYSPRGSVVALVNVKLLRKRLFPTINTRKSLL